MTTDYRKPKTMSQLEAENTELRELVTSMWRVLSYANAVYSENDGFRDRMAALDMEVDG